MNNLINIDDVEKYYGSNNNIKKVLNRISFCIDKGEFTGIMGPSGSGKTTLLNVISTIDNVTSGHIYYENKDITEMGEDDLSDFRKDNLGFVFQDFNLLDTLTIKENIMLTMTIRNKPKNEIKDTVNDILKKLNIYEIRNKFPYEVSGGQKQRCACARAIINNPKLVLADEPTGALDSKSAQMLLETFELMNTELKTTILMVTHDVISASYCKRILFLKDGEIFYELIKGNKSRRDFFNEILDVLAFTGGDPSDEK